MQIKPRLLVVKHSKKFFPHQKTLLNTVDNSVFNANTLTHTHVMSCIIGKKTNR